MFDVLKSNLDNNIYCLIADWFLHGSNLLWHGRVAMANQDELFNFDCVWVGVGANASLISASPKATSYFITQIKHTLHNLLYK